MDDFKCCISVFDSENIHKNKNKEQTDFYERHHYDDPSFPVIFHFDTLKGGQRVIPHWHQNPEILYFVEGNAKITLNSEAFEASVGDIVITPPNYIHTHSTDSRAKYYCLIPDLEFCKSFDIEADSIDYIHHIHDDALNRKMDIIVSEFENKENYYKPVVLAEIISFLGYAARHYTDASPSPLSEKKAAHTEMIRKTFAFIENHYYEALTIDSLAEQAGLTKYYFCHIFKQLTGMTPISYINYIRCRKAKKFLTSNAKYTVGETAELCGFSNLSYFTRTYQKYNGCLPSQDLNGNHMN